MKVEKSIMDSDSISFSYTAQTAPICNLCDVKQDHQKRHTSSQPFYQFIQLIPPMIFQHPCRTIANGWNQQ